MNISNNDKIVNFSIHRSTLKYPFNNATMRWRPFLSYKKGIHPLLMHVIVLHHKNNLFFSLFQFLIFRLFD